MAGFAVISPVGADLVDTSGDQITARQNGSTHLGNNADIGSTINKMKFLSRFIAYLSIMMIPSCYAVERLYTDSYSATGGIFLGDKWILLYSLPDDEYSAEKLSLLNGLFTSSKIKLEKKRDSYWDAMDRINKNYHIALEKINNERGSSDIEYEHGGIGSGRWHVTVSMIEPGNLVSKFYMREKLMLKVERSLIMSVRDTVNGKSDFLLVESVSCGAVSCSTDLYSFKEN
ncbi:hypothetical protein [Gallaecimonas sp. GXIMD1310]|uniref:hypothetical protein n=1 Tax=Gallaecimonas sp. GXIMD1310 TaxID=3131926 RepID=UPI0032553548